MKPRNTFRALTAVAALGLATLFALSSCDSSTNGGGNGGLGDVTPITVGLQGQAVQINQGSVLRYSFEAKPGGTYQITTTGNTDVDLILLDSTGKPIQLDQTPNSVNGTLTYTDTSKVRVTLIVSVQGKTSSTTGGTILTVVMTSGPDDFEPDNGISRATTIPTDSTIQSHTLSASDHDWIKFSATEGTAYSIETIGSLDTYIKLFNSDSVELAERDDGGVSSGASKMIWMCPKSGTYAVDVRGYSTSTSGSYSFAVKAQPASRYPDRGESNNSTSKAFRLAIDSTYNLFFFSGDTDCYAIPATAGQPLKIALSSSASFGGASLSTPDGAIVTSSVGTGGYTFIPSATGNYQLRFVPPSFGSSNGAFGAYSLTLTATTPQDLSHAATIPTDSTQLTRTLASGDNNWFKFTADSGSIYAMETSGSLDTYIKLFNSDSVELAERDDGGSYSGASRLVWLCSKSGTYYVDIRGYSTTTSGSYGFAVKTQPASRYPDRGESNNSAAKAFGLAVDSTYNLYFFSGDTDYYAIAAVSGQPVRIALSNSGSAYGSASLISPDGTILSSSITATAYTFTPGATGTYLLRFAPSPLGSTNGAYGAYTVGITNPAPQDLAHATSIGTDSTLVTKVMGAGDNNWFKFTADSGSIYAMETNSSLNTYIKLFNSDSTELVERDDGGTYSGASKLVWLCSKSGTYYVDIRGYSTSTSGSYGFAVKTQPASRYPDRGESNNGAAKAFGLAMDSTYALYFFSGDTDYYAIPAVSGQLVRIAIGSSGSSYGSASLYSPDGSVLVSSVTTSGYTFKPSSTGTYLLRVAPPALGSTNGAYGAYTLTVTSPEPQDLAHATTIATDSTQATRVLAAGDNFWFKFTADSGAIYAMETSGSIDTYLKLFTSDSVELAERDGNGSSSSPARMVWLCPKSGTYYVDAKGYPSGTSTVTGSFGFAVKSQPASRYPDRGEFNNNAGSAFPLSLDSTYNLYFFSGDTDCYSFPAKAGSSYRISSTYSGSSYSTVSLYAPDGTILTSAAGGSYNFNATQTGNYLLRFAPATFGSSNGGNGSYTLGASEILPQNLANASPISTDSTSIARSLVGTSTTPDNHYFKFAADSGRVYFIQTQSTNSTDTYLWLMNPDSSIITERDDGGSPSTRGQAVAWLCNRTGTYYVGVKGYSGSTGPYSISVKAHSSADFPDPSEPNSSRGQAFALTLGTAASLYFTSGDTDWVSISCTGGTTYTPTFTYATSSAPFVATWFSGAGSSIEVAGNGYGYTPPTDGTYYIRLTPSTSTSSGYQGVFTSYTVKVQ